MIIQNTNTDPPVFGVVADVVKAKPALGVAVESPRITTTQVIPEQLNNAVAVINQVMRESNSSLQFSVDTDTKVPVVKLLDTKTGEVIRQIPSEETLAISHSIDLFQQQHGLLLKQEA